jgi:hypothetical protein
MGSVEVERKATEASRSVNPEAMYIDHVHLGRETNDPGSRDDLWSKKLLVKTEAWRRRSLMWPLAALFSKMWCRTLAWWRATMPTRTGAAGICCVDLLCRERNERRVGGAL